jgi:hypothetical protein
LENPQKIVLKRMKNIKKEIVDVKNINALMGEN